MGDGESCREYYFSRVGKIAKYVFSSLWFSLLPLLTTFFLNHIFSSSARLFMISSPLLSRVSMVPFICIQIFSSSDACQISHCLLSAISLTSVCSSGPFIYVDVYINVPQFYMHSSSRAIAVLRGILHFIMFSLKKNASSHAGVKSARADYGGRFGSQVSSSSGNSQVTLLLAGPYFVQR